MAGNEQHNGRMSRLSPVQRAVRIPVSVILFVGLLVVLPVLQRANGHQILSDVQITTEVAASPTQWAPLDIPTIHNLYQISCGSASDCVAVGGVSSGWNSGSPVIETTDGGLTWGEDSVPSDVGVAWSVSCGKVDNCNLETRAGELYESTPGTFSLGTSSDFYATSCVAGSEDCFAIGPWYRETAMYDTTTDGSAWAPFPDSDDPWVGLDDLLSCFPSDCVTVTPVSSGEQVAYDGGADAWTIPDSDDTSYFSLDCTSDSFCAAAGEGGDGGAVVTTFDPATGTSSASTEEIASSSVSLNDVYCADANVCAVSGSNASSDPLILVTGDASASDAEWSSETMPSDVGSIESITCAATGKCFAAGDLGNGDGVVLEDAGPDALTEANIAAPEQYDGGDHSANRASCTCDPGEPVTPNDGDFWTSDTDVSVPTAGPPLSFSRSYDAFLAEAETEDDTPGPLGYGWSNNLSSSLTLDSYYGSAISGDVTITDSSGAEVAYVPASGSPPECPEGYSFPDGSGSTSGAYCAASSVSASLVYDSGSDQYVFTYRDGDSDVFDSSGQLSEQMDRNGLSETYSYGSPSPGSGACPSSASACDEVTAAGGRTLTVALDSSGRIREVIEPGGQAWSYGYNSDYDLTSVTDPDGNVTSYSYDSSNSNPSLTNELVAITNPNGQTGGPDAGDELVNTYDSAGRVTSQTDPAGLTTSFDYSEMNAATGTGETLVTNPTGSKTLYEYSGGLLTAETTGYGTSAAATTSYEYDPTTLLPSEVTDPDGNSTTNTYDADGDLLTTTDALGKTTTNTYNSFGEVLTVTPPLGAETVNEYDSDGNLETTTVKGEDVSGNTAPNLVTSYTYGDSSFPGSPTEVTDPDGDVTDYSYDSSGDVASVTTHPTGSTSSTTTYAYDSNGDLYCEVSPNENGDGVSCPSYGSSHVAGTTSYTLNGDGEITGVTDPDGNSSSTTYDGDGNATLDTDPNGVETSYTYDADDRLTIEEVGSNGSNPETTSYGYDLQPGSSPCSSSVTGAQYCESTEDPNGHTTVDYYDASDRLIETSRPGSITTSYGYDDAGNLTSMTDAAGRTTTYGYNDDNELTSVSYSDGLTPSVTYSYNALGDRTAMTDGTGTTSYTYDGDERLTSVTDGNGTTTSYGYDDDGNVTCLSYPGATSTCSDSGNTTGSDLVNRTYNGAGELENVTDWNGNETTFDYDDDGNLTSTVYPNADTVASSYDADDDMTSTDVAPTSSPDSPLASVSYGYDDADLVSSESDSGALGSDTHSYNYDGNEQLSSADGATVGYDGDGNLTTTPSGVTEDYNSSDELTTATSGSGTTTFGYDAVGELTSESTPESSSDYTFDQAGDMTSATTNPSPVAQVSAGPDDTLVVTSTGHVGAFGSNADGQIGNGTTTTAETPVVLSSPGDVVQVAAGDGFSLALSASGDVYSWGDNADGQLGLGTTTNETSPQKITGLSNVVAIAAGSSFALAVTQSGDVYSWGDNSDGQLGLGTTTTETSPTKVDSLSDVSSVAAGSSFALALTTSGAAYAWGDNSYGQLGDGSTTTEHSPVELTDEPSFGSLAAGGDHSLALTATGQLYTWGENNDGQLGTDDTTNEDTPTEVTGIGTTVASIAAGADHSLAVTSAGELYAWGLNSSYQLGTGDTTDEDSPTAISTGSVATVYSGSGADQSFGLGSSGSLYEWGDNASYQLGDDSTSNIESPTVLSGVTTELSSASETTTYNGDGLLASSETAAGTAHFTWDTTTSVPEVISDGSNDYLYGPTGTPVEQISSSNTSYFFQDRLGSTRALLSSSGDVVSTYSYNATGAISNSTGTDATPILFAGGYLDQTTGDYYLINRYYDPTTGHFLSVDPLVDETDEPYGYVAGDPVNGTDPSGESGAAADTPPGQTCGGGPSGDEYCVGNGLTPRECEIMVDQNPSLAGDCESSCPSSIGQVASAIGDFYEQLFMMDSGPDEEASLGDLILSVAEDGGSAAADESVQGVPVDSDLGQILRRGAHTTTDVHGLFEHLAEHYGVSPEEANKELHAIKAQMEGNPDVVFTRSGGVYDATSGDHLGDLVP